MILINRIAVYPRDLFAGRIRAITVGIGVISLAHLSAPLYGQSSTWGASPTWVTNVNVGVGTSAPLSLLDVRSANSTAAVVYIGSTSPFSANQATEATINLV